MNPRTRILLTALSAFVLLGGAVIFALVARDSGPPLSKGDSRGTPSLAAHDRLIFLSGRHLASVPANATTGHAVVSDLQCVRVYAAAGTGACMHQDDPWHYSLLTLDATLRQTSRHKIAGLPNRLRVSASGQMVSWTTFIGGESYNKGGFSTRTGILDLRTGTSVPNLETFAIHIAGHRSHAIDHNVWGVTFASDDNRFYASLATGDDRYLVQGDLAARTLTTLESNVECPSLSPDGTRIAFKQAVDNDPRKGWRLSVLDLKTRTITHLAETASVDDQAAWLDDSTVAYTLRAADGTPSIWSVPADGSGNPTLVRNNAESPAVI